MQNPTEGRRLLAASYAQLGRLDEVSPAPSPTPAAPAAPAAETRELSTTETRSHGGVPEQA